jgi:hypothetical protein
MVSLAWTPFPLEAKSFYGAQMANENKSAQPLETSYHSSLEDQSHHLLNSLSLSDWQEFSARTATKGAGEPASGEISFENDIYGTKNTAPSLNNFENIMNPICATCPSV